jgi:hypothetical protein
VVAQAAAAAVAFLHGGNPRRRRATTHGTLELLRDGRVTPIADVSDLNGGLMNYGHYDWPQRIAVESP